MAEVRFSGRQCSLNMAVSHGQEEAIHDSLRQSGGKPEVWSFSTLCYASVFFVCLFVFWLILLCIRFL
jgi:hypothetical protein